MKTISLFQQIKASREIYKAALENIESLTDSELRNAMISIASAGTVARVLSIASAGTVARVLSIASAGTVARVLSIASDDTVDRVLSIASAGTVARVLSIASDDTVDRVNILSNLLVPVVEDLDKKVLAESEAGNLNMRDWNCGTTHCRAGLAVVFGGDDGKKLESVLGSELAGRLIYEASTGRIAPDFYASNNDAIDDIRRCAAI